MSSRAWYEQGIIMKIITTRLIYFYLLSNQLSRHFPPDALLIILITNSTLVVNLNKALKQDLFIYLSRYLQYLPCLFIYFFISLLVFLRLRCARKMVVMKFNLWYKKESK